MASDDRLWDIRFDYHIVIVEQMDGHNISASLLWYPRLSSASAEKRATLETCAGGYAIHWAKVSEDLRTKGLLREVPVTKVAQN